MAVGRGKQPEVSKHEASGYISDESDFYGDEATIEDLENRVDSFSTKDWWRNKEPSLTEMANSNVASATESKSATLYNPYEGQFCGRQLGESVQEFLERLPPATSQASETLPWIFIANPFRKAPTSTQGDSSKGKLAAEAPEDDDSDWAQFVVLGGKLLEELTSLKHEIERKKAGQAKGTITKAVNVQKEMIVQKILGTAVDLHCTSGKWLLFCDSGEVDAVWAVVARATAENELGIAAKVAPDDGQGDRRPRVICVYTKDFTDMKDVSRVVHKLRDLGLVETKGRGIHYKCDAYTYLNLGSGNQYDIKASLYNSTDLLKPKDQRSKDGKLEGFFHKRKKDEEDWRSLEWE